MDRWIRDLLSCNSLLFFFFPDLFMTSNCDIHSVRSSIVGMRAWEERTTGGDRNIRKERMRGKESGIHPRVKQKRIRVRDTVTSSSSSCANRAANIGVSKNDSTLPIVKIRCCTTLYSLSLSSGSSGRKWNVLFYRTSTAVEEEREDQTTFNYNVKREKKLNDTRESEPLGKRNEEHLNLILLLQIQTHHDHHDSACDWHQVMRRVNKKEWKRGENDWEEEWE